MTKPLRIAIDFGTNFCCVTYWDETEKKHKIIPNNAGSNTTPSVVAFSVPRKKGEDHKSERLVGHAALSQSTRNPTNTIFNVKRLLGRRFSNIDLQRDIKNWACKIEPDADDKPKIICNYNGQER